MNTDEPAAFGNRSLKVTANRMESGENVLVYKKTYYRPADFHDSRYDPAFSPAGLSGTDCSWKCNGAGIWTVRFAGKSLCT